MGGARGDGRFPRASKNARPLQRCDATRYAILEAPIRAAASLATRYPGSPTDTTHSSTVEGIIDAPVSGALRWPRSVRVPRPIPLHTGPSRPSSTRRPWRPPPPASAMSGFRVSNARWSGPKASSKSRSGTQNRAISADPGRMRTAVAILTPSNCQEPVGRESAIYMAMTRVRMVR
jgi:hypothetical protein